MQVWKISRVSSESRLTLVVVWDVRHPETVSEPQNYVELKTSKIITGERDQVAFERKLMRIWAQSFLLGVPRIMVGFRDDDGILRKVEEFETQKIPTIAKKSGRKLWDGNYAVDFAGAWLAWIKSSIPDDEDGVVWRIRKGSNQGTVELVRTEEKSFLTDEFVAWRTNTNFN